LDKSLLSKESKEYFKFISVAFVDLIHSEKPLKTLKNESNSEILPEKLFEENLKRKILETEDGLLVLEMPTFSGQTYDLSEPNRPIIDFDERG